MRIKRFTVSKPILQPPFCGLDIFYIPVPLKIWIIYHIIVDFI